MTKRTVAQERGATPRLRRGASEQLFRWLTWGVFLGPWFIVALTAIEAATLGGIGEVKILGLGPGNWILLDVLHGGTTAPRQVMPYSTALINFVGFFGDRNKILPYSALCAWLLLIPPVLVACFRRAPATKLGPLIVVWSALTIAAIVGYDLSQLLGNRHEHWTGTTRKGLFSALGWLLEEPVDRPGIASILSIVAYRLTYSIHTALLFALGIFTACAIVIAAPYMRAGKSAHGSRLVGFVPAWVAARWSDQERGNDGGIGSVVRRLVGVTLGAVAGFLVIAYSGNLEPVQVVGALVIGGIGAATLIVFISRKTGGLAQLLGFVAIAGGMTSLAFLPTAYERVSVTWYRLRYVEVRQQRLERIHILSPVLTGIGTAYMNSMNVLEDVRQVWERAHQDVASIDRGSAELANEVDRAVVLLWLTQLSRLEQLVGDSSTEDHAPPGDRAESAEALVLTVARPVFLEQDPGYAWRVLRFSRGSRAWRWWDDLHRQSIKWSAQVLKSPDRLAHLALWPIRDGTPSVEVAASREDVEAILNAYRLTPLGGLIVLPPPSTKLGREVSDLIQRIETDRIWRSNLRFHLQTLRAVQ